VRAWPRSLDLLPALLVFGLVWYGSSIPAEKMPDSNLLAFDKLLHFGEYAVVSAALLWAVRRSPRLPEALCRLSFVMGAGLVWAILDEIHQGFVGRDSSMFDLLADGLGLLAFAGLHLSGWLQRLPGYTRLWALGTDKRA
jgi:hypothetical protein